MKNQVGVMTGRLVALLIALLVALLFAVSPLQAAQMCASPGRLGDVSASGVVNTYWAAPKVSLAAGQTHIPLGAKRGKGQLRPGDLLMVIQMQGATINAHNDSRYGSGEGTGSGWKTLTAGHFEMVRVQRVINGQAVISGAGPGSGLLYSYLYRSPQQTMDQGRARWQLVRVPQYSSLLLRDDVTALPWNGTTGGVLALDVRGTLSLAGNYLDVVGSGFRGGAALPVYGALGASDDYRYEAPTATNWHNGYGQHGSKGEGLAGTPRWVFDGQRRRNTLPENGRNSSDGYPGGSMARGAPANAGGGGESLNLDNTKVSAGGGGGGLTPGGTGTDGAGDFVGGLGGAGVGVSSAVPLLVMGGGGGAAAIGGKPSWQGAGGNGGGIIVVMAGHIRGPGTLDVSGENGRDAPAGGGGGGAGSLLIWTPLPATSHFNVVLAGGQGGRGTQGIGGDGGVGRLLLGGRTGIQRNAGHFDSRNWPGVVPGFACQPDGMVVAGRVTIKRGGSASSQPIDETLAGWPYRIRLGDVPIMSGMTDKSGRFSIALPPSVAGQTLTLSVSLPPDWRVVDANNDPISGLVYLGEGQWHITPQSGGYYQQLRLGVVKSPSLTFPENRRIVPDSTQIFLFRYQSHAKAKVQFEVQTKIAGNVNTTPTLFVDPHCNGDSEFATHGKSAEFPVKAGQDFCLRLKVVVGKTHQPGETLSWKLKAATQLAKPGRLPVIRQHWQKAYEIKAEN